MSEAEWVDIFADNLISMINDYGLSQRELADMIGVSEVTLSHYVNKKRMPGIKTIVNLSYALNCDINDLIDFGDRID